MLLTQAARLGIGPLFMVVTDARAGLEQPWRQRTLPRVDCPCELPDGHVDSIALGKPGEALQPPINTPLTRRLANPIRTWRPHWPAPTGPEQA